MHQRAARRVISSTAVIAGVARLQARDPQDRIVLDRGHVEIGRAGDEGRAVLLPRDEDGLVTVSDGAEEGDPLALLERLAGQPGRLQLGGG